MPIYTYIIFTTAIIRSDRATAVPSNLPAVKVCYATTVSNRTHNIPWLHSIAGGAIYIKRGN